MRAALDPNVIVSGMLSPAGPPAKLLEAWLEAEFEIVVSPDLLDELERVFAYPKIRARVTEEESGKMLELLREGDPAARRSDRPPSVKSRDAGDDYLIALAESREAFLVSGDDDLLALKGKIPVYAPRDFLDLLTSS